MKTIIAGPRWICDFQLIKIAIHESNFDITEVVTGDAKGVDWLGAYWGYLNNLPVKHFPAKWEFYGTAAGPIRNKLMADYADALIAVWDEISRGTNNMINTARKLELQIYIKYVNTKPKKNIL